MTKQFRFPCPSLCYLLGSRVGTVSFQGRRAEEKAPLPPGKQSSQARPLGSWGSQMELAEELEMGLCLFLLSPAGSSALTWDPEAHSAVSSILSESPVFKFIQLWRGGYHQHWGRRIWGVADSLPTYEELVEVVTHAVAKLNIGWPVEEVHLPESLALWSQTTLWSWGWVSTGIGQCPGLEMFTSYPSPMAALSLKAPMLDTKPCRMTYNLVGKAYVVAGHVCILWESCRHTRLTC